MVAVTRHAICTTSPFPLKRVPLLLCPDNSGDGTHSLLCLIHAFIAIDQQHLPTPVIRTQKTNVAFDGGLPFCLGFSGGYHNRGNPSFPVLCEGTRPKRKPKGEGMG